MISFFVDSYTRALQLRPHLRSTTRETDGPFRVIQGRLRGQDVFVYAVEPATPDAAYAAAAMAQRRGATRMTPITGVSVATPEIGGLAIGQMLPVSAIWNLAGLTPLLRLLPESATELPIDPSIPQLPLWREDVSGIGVGTVPFAFRNRALLDFLEARCKIVALDARLSGYAACAMEHGVILRPAALIDSFIVGTAVKKDVAMRSEAEVEKSLDRLFAS